MEDLVSIITPTYNSDEFISDTIKSVQEQTYKNWEMIIVDDLSTDNTFQIISSYLKNDKRIIYFQLEKNSGAAVARNKGIELANGKYIAFLDSDDMWIYNKLEKQISFMKDNNYNITCTSYTKISEHGISLNNIVKCALKANYNRILLDCPVGNSTVIYNVEILGKFKIPNIRKRNDDALWLQILKKEKFIFGLNDVLMKYRIRKNSISSNKFSLIKYHWILYRDIEKLSILRSSFHLIIWIILKIFKIK